MKFRLSALFIFLFVVLGAVAPLKSNAAALWADCDIVRIVQPNTNQISVFLTEKSSVFVNKYFKIDNTKQKEQLAVLLTALSMNKQVQIRFEDTTSVITHVGIINN